MVANRNIIENRKNLKHLHRFEHNFSVLMHNDLP